MRRVLLWQAMLGSVILSAAALSSGPAQENPARDALLAAQEAAKDAPVEQALAAYQRVIDEFPGTIPAGQALASLTSLCIGNQMPDEALAGSERLLGEFGHTWLAGSAIRQKAHVLLHMQRRPQEALDFLLETVPRYEHLFPPADYTQVVLLECDACLRLGDRPAALDTLAQGALRHPQLLANAGFFARYLPGLRAAGMRGEALSAAKAAFACCPFTEAEVKRSTDAMVKSWVALGELQTAGAFLAALEDPAADNPLTEVAWPAITDEDKEFMLTNAGNNVAVQISVLLYVGDCDGALNLATMGLGDAQAPQQISAWVELVARCLKAKDLNLSRANAFLDFVKKGEGENPLADM